MLTTKAVAVPPQKVNYHVSDFFMWNKALVDVQQKIYTVAEGDSNVWGAVKMDDG